MIMLMMMVVLVSVMAIIITIMTVNDTDTDNDNDKIVNDINNYFADDIDHEVMTDTMMPDDTKYRFTCVLSKFFKIKARGNS